MRGDCGIRGALLYLFADCGAVRRCRRLSGLTPCIISLCTLKHIGTDRVCTYGLLPLDHIVHTHLCS